jgi:hypothetical protein
MIGLPSFQSVIVSVPKKYCFIMSGFVKACHTREAEACMLVLTFPVIPFLMAFTVWY